MSTATAASPELQHSPDSPWLLLRTVLHELSNPLFVALLNAETLQKKLEDSASLHGTQPLLDSLHSLATALTTCNRFVAEVKTLVAAGIEPRELYDLRRLILNGWKTVRQQLGTRRCVEWNADLEGDPVPVVGHEVPMGRAIEQLLQCAAERYGTVEIGLESRDDAIGPVLTVRGRHIAADSHRANSNAGASGPDRFPVRTASALRLVQLAAEMDGGSVSITENHEGLAVRLRLPAPD